MASSGRETTAASRSRTSAGDVNVTRASSWTEPRSKLPHVRDAGVSSQAHLLVRRGVVPGGQEYGRTVLMTFSMTSSVTCPGTFRSAKTVKKTGPTEDEPGEAAMAIVSTTACRGMQAPPPAGVTVTEARAAVMPLSVMVPVEPVLTLGWVGGVSARPYAAAAHLRASSPAADRRTPSWSLDGFRTGREPPRTPDATRMHFPFSIPATPFSAARMFDLASWK